MNFLKKIFEGKTSNEKELLDAILVLDKEGKHQEIINLIDELSTKEKTPNILSEQARAYNNLSWNLDYNENDEHLKCLQKAVEIFKSIEKYQGENPLWNYRIGYSYFFLDDIENAKKHLYKGDKERSQELIEIIEYAEKHNIPLEVAKTNFIGDHHLYETEEIESLENYIESNFGKIGNVFHEIISPDIHCDIYVIEPTEEQDYYTLVTGGMGAYDMNVSEHFNSPQNAELVIHLPKDWNLQSKEEEDYWPLRWLKLLARLPIEQETFLGWGHTIPTGEALEGTNFKGFLLVSADDKNNSDEIACVQLPTEREVYFYHIIPIYEEEMYFKLENDAGNLLELFSDNNILYPPVVDINRPNVCVNFQPTENDTLLDDLQWTFTNKEQLGLMPFFDEVKAYNDSLNNELESFTPFATMFQTEKIKVMYDAWVKDKEDLYEYEIVTDEKYFNQEPQNGYYYVRIVATFDSVSGNTFGALETLFVVHNALSNKELRGNSCFEGFEVIGEEQDGTPLLYLLLSSKEE